MTSTLVRFGERSAQEVISGAIAAYTTKVTCKGSLSLNTDELKDCLVYVGSQFVYDMLGGFLMPLVDKVFPSEGLAKLSELVAEVLGTATISYMGKRYIRGRAPSFMMELLFVLSASSIADKLNDINLLGM